jgi:hypothetical protein
VQPKAAKLLLDLLLSARRRHPSSRFDTHHSPTHIPCLRSVAMAAPPPPPPPRGVFSLYGDLLDPSDASSSATISSAPVVYTQVETADLTPKKPIDPALRFQPIRRPQVKQQKPKQSALLRAVPKPTAVPVSTPAAPVASTNSSAAPAKSTLADWAATGEDDLQYGLGEKRQRGGRKNKKKRQQAHAETDWEDMYDPTRTTGVDEFTRSDEKIDEEREWKGLLYKHRKRTPLSDLSDEDDEPRHVPSGTHNTFFLSRALILALALANTYSSSICSSSFSLFCTSSTLSSSRGATTATT